MSARETNNLFERLTPEQRKLIASKKHQGRRTISDWLSFYRAPTAIDRKGEVVASRASKGMNYSFIVAALSLFFGVFFVFSNSPLGIPLLILGGVTLILGILFLRRRKKFKNLTIRNHLRLTLVPVLAILSKELKPQSQVSLTLDLVNPLVAKNLTKHIPVRSRSLPKVDTKFYEKYWLDASFRTMDRVDIQWRMREIIRYRQITKRGRVSGKVKSKTKYKTKHIMELKVSFPKEHFQIKTADLKTFRYQETQTHHCIKLKYKAESREVNAAAPVNFVLQGFTSAYKLVSPC